MSDANTEQIAPCELSRPNTIRLPWRLLSFLIAATICDQSAIYIQSPKQLGPAFQSSFEIWLNNNVLGTVRSVAITFSIVHASVIIICLNVAKRDGYRVVIAEWLKAVGVDKGDGIEGWVA